MSTEPDAPSDDDATRQEQAKDATSNDERQVVWRVTPELVEQWLKNPELFEQFKKAMDRSDEQANAYNESIMLAAFRYNSYADPPEPIPSLIHSNVTIDDMRNVEDLLSDIFHALCGNRHFLDRLKHAVKAVRVWIGDIPQGRDEQKLYFLVRFRNILPLYVKDGEFDPTLPAQLFRMNRHFVDCDPAFAKLDNGYVAECIKSMKNVRGKYANDWKRVAARIAVKVGAFDSANMGTTDEERIKNLMADFGPKWTQRDRTKFREHPLPPQKKEKPPVKNASTKKRSRPV